MADLNETPVWENGIYQIETTDGVAGGPPNINGGQGLANAGVAQLANRTGWLKATMENGLAAAALLAAIKTVDGPGSGLNADTVDGKHYAQIVTDIVAEVTGAAPATLDTLNELAAAMGDDPNFATTITAAIAAKLGTNDKAADAHLLDGVDGSDYARKDVTATQEFAAALGVNGDRIEITRLGGNAFFYLRGANADPYGLLYKSHATGEISLRRYNGAGSVEGEVRLTNNGDIELNSHKAWHAGDAAYSLASNGYQRLPSGLILQWGTGSASNGGSVSFPIAFPNACLFAIAGDSNVGENLTNAQNIGVSGTSTTAFTIAVHNLDGTAAATANGCRFFALGT